MILCGNFITPPRTTPPAACSVLATPCIYMASGQIQRPPNRNSTYMIMPLVKTDAAILIKVQ